MASLYTLRANEWNIWLTRTSKGGVCRKRQCNYDTYAAKHQGQNILHCIIITMTKSITVVCTSMENNCVIVIIITSTISTPVQINSSPPSAAYMRQWIGSALVQIMACRLFGAKTLSKPVLDQNKKLFSHENAPESIVCEMAAILFRGRWVKYLLSGIKQGRKQRKIYLCRHYD